MLGESPRVSLARFDHPPGAALPTTFSAHQAAERFRINVVERGTFRLRYGRREWTLGAGAIFLSRPADEYRYSHVRHVEPDTTLRLEFSESLGAELADVFNDLPLVPPPSNRLAFSRLQLCSTADSAEMSLDTLACELLDAARNAVDGRHLYRPKQLQWYAQRIGAAREVMEADPTAQHSLWQLSSQVAMSPFLFARVFRELMGAPPHKYLLRLRLERARSLLQSGMSVTDACYAVGFNNLSHFIRTFRRHFGCLPSETRPSRAV
jgi:AraC-like DNA-binding protein